MNKRKKSNKLFSKLILAIPALSIALIGIYVIAAHSNNSPEDTTLSTVSKIEYLNGSYEESITYQVPKGTNSLTAKVIIKNDIVTEVSTNHSLTSNKSKEYTDQFDLEIPQVIVGKNIKDLDIGIIGGASGTSNAFKALIEAIMLNSR